MGLWGSLGAPEPEDLMDTYAKLDTYGVSYEGEQGAYVDTEESLTLSELASIPSGRIVRVRWIGGDYIPGRGRCYDLSYVHGEYDVVVEGRFKKTVRVRLEQTPAAFLIPRHQRKGAMIDWARSEGVYAKKLGLLDDGNWSTLG